MKQNLKQMGVESETVNISPNSMEEIEIFKTAESPTGERIKLFVDELEPFVTPYVEAPLDLPVPKTILPRLDCLDLGFDEVDE